MVTPRHFAWLLATLALPAAGCADDEREETPVSVAIDFDLRVHAEPFACNEEYPDIGTPPKPFTFTDARFYVHGVELIDRAGKAHPVTLDDTAFSARGIALLDFEEDCGPDGTPEINTSVTGTVPPGTYRELRFTLGIPSEENFIDLPTAAAPLDVTGMYWTWQSGYKFLKVDGFSPAPDGGIETFLLHVGASGCPGDNPTSPPNAACEFPNQATYELDWDGTAGTVVAQLSDLFAASDVGANTAGTAPGCMSEPKDPECAVLLPRLGIDDASDQRLFDVE